MPTPHLRIKGSIRRSRCWWRAQGESGEFGPWELEFREFDPRADGILLGHVATLAGRRRDLNRPGAPGLLSWVRERFPRASAWRPSWDRDIAVRLAPPPVSAEAVEPVADPRLARLIAALADRWEEGDEDLRRDLEARFWAYYPDLRERAASGQGRRVARLAGD